MYNGSMTRLHPRLEESLPRLPEGRPVHLFTRHSIREKADNGFADYRLALTPEGVALAREWGGRLGRPVAAFYSSPVPRCVDTARAMADGLRERGLIVEDPQVQTIPVLVEPGCYVEDVNRAGPEFFRLGAVRFINRHLEQGLEGVLSPRQGRAKLVRHLLETDPQSGSMAVHVTHDTILAAFVAGLHGHASVSDDDWPWMMEGLWLWFAEDRLHWLWRGEPGSLGLSEALSEP